MRAPSHEPHTAIPNVQLKTIPVMLELVHPTRASGRALGHDRTAGINKAGRRIEWPPAGTTRHTADIIGLGLKLQINWTV